MNSLEPTFERTATVWWAFVWRAVLFAVCAGFVVGFIEGLVGTIAGFPREAILSIARVSGFAVAIPTRIYALQLVLRKRFSEFTIRLVPTVTELGK